MIDYMEFAYAKRAIQEKLIMVVEDYILDKKVVIFLKLAIIKKNMKKIPKKPKTRIYHQQMQYIIHQKAILPKL